MSALLLLNAVHDSQRRGQLENGAWRQTFAMRSELCIADSPAKPMLPCVMEVR
jgi:hypothetical protein